MVKIKKKHKEYEYIINFSFPLVGEVMNKIYSEIIKYNPNIYSNIADKLLDVAVKKKFFEKVVIYYLNIKNFIQKNEKKKSITFFEDYPIEFHEEMNVLVLNDDETLEKNLNEKILEEKGVYLITQERYNGKALNMALLKIGDINELIGIEISIHEDRIFSLEEIEKFLKNLRDNVKSTYNINVEDSNLFFCYIFEWNNNIDEKIVKKFKDKRIKYFFFDVKNKIFKDKDGQIIKKLKPNIGRSSISSNNKKGYHSLDEYFYTQKTIKSNYNSKNFEKEPNTNIIAPTLKGPIFKINERQEKAIKIILKNDFNLLYEPKINYIYSMNSLNKTRICDFSISQLLKEKDTLGMATRMNTFYSIKSNGIFSNIITNTAQELDCYEIS